MRFKLYLFIIASSIALLCACGNSNKSALNSEVSTSINGNSDVSGLTSQRSADSYVSEDTEQAKLVETTEIKPKLKFPRLDSSTARKDMVAAIYEDLVINGEMTGMEPLCSKTHDAIINLINGKVDVVFALLPTEEEQKYMSGKGVDLKARCYAYDGLLILGNSENPVKNLSSDQLRDIYRKKITNWKEVGGLDAEITVYVRDSQSGSQRMFESLVWSGQDNVPDFQDGSYDDMEVDEMGKIINLVEFDPNAIGFSFLTFVDEEYGSSENLKSFSIDGIEPTNSNISNESYPFVTTAWMLMRADEQSNSSAQWLFDWFVGENAKKYITNYTSSVPAKNAQPIIVKAN